MERDPGLADAEAARLLREMATKPRQAIIWPHAHGAWSANVHEALVRGAERLEETPPMTEHELNEADDLTPEEVEAIRASQQRGDTPDPDDEQVG